MLDTTWWGMPPPPAPNGRCVVDMVPNLSSELFLKIGQINVGFADQLMCARITNKDDLKVFGFMKLLFLFVDF